MALLTGRPCQIRGAAPVVAAASLSDSPPTRKPARAKLWQSSRTCAILYAHNYGGEADAEYAQRPRHVLVRGTAMQLTVGARFDGQWIQLDLPHLKAYAQVAREVLQRFS